MRLLPHSDNNPMPGRIQRCERCGEDYPRGTSAWDLCLRCLEHRLAAMPTEDLADVPGAVLQLFGLKEEYFRE